MIFNVVAIVLAVLALLSSTYLAVHQTILMRRANYLPAYMGFLNEFRSLRFNDHYRYVCDRLRAEHDPDLGISGLPDEARAAIYDIAYFFQNLAAFRRLGIIEDQVSSSMNIRFVQVWDTVEPYVERERELIDTPLLMRVLEDFAIEARHAPARQRSRLHRRRRPLATPRDL